MKDRLLTLIKQKAFIKKKVILSSGKESSYYVDVRKISLSSEGLYLIVKKIWAFIKINHITAVGGPTIGADPIIGGLLYMASLRGCPLKGFLIRAKRKEHGRKSQIEGEIPDERDRILLIDDVATSGSSLIASLKVLRKIGLEPFACLCVVDRLEGARENIEKKGVIFFSLYTIKDLTL